MSSQPCRVDHGRCCFGAGWSVPDNYLVLRFNDDRVYAYRLTSADIPEAIVADPARVGCWFNHFIRFNSLVGYQFLGVGEVLGVNWLWSYR